MVILYYHYMLNKRLDGFLLIDKEEGWTSFDVCKKVKGICQTRKIGHSGTLDPFATGLLVIAVNEACKVLTFLHDEPKEYLATLKLGIKTDTGDKTGKVISSKEVFQLRKDLILDVFHQLIGKQKQIPPMTSAIHINGVKLYKLAHRGVEIERRPRNIEIFSLKLLNFSKDEITFIVSTSSGTYIRTLGETIAEKLMTVGHLTSLRRLSIDNLKIEMAKKINEISQDDLFSINQILPLSQKKLEGRLLELAIHGNPINLDVKEERLLIVDQSNKPIGIYRREDNKIFISERGLNI